MAMAEKKEQAKPLAPSIHRCNPEENNNDPLDFTTRRRVKCIKYFGCLTAIFLLVVTIILVLMFTTFRVKDPSLKINSTTIEGLDSVTRTGDFHRGLNATLVLDFLIKNSNVASFKINDTTANVYYDGSVIGETRAMSGLVRARKNLRMNVLIELMVDKILKVQRLRNDLTIGLLPISSIIRVSGRVKITNAIKRDVEVNMNCNMNVNTNSKEIQDRNCRNRVAL